MKKFSYEFIKKQIEKEGYWLLSEKYINNKVKLEILCNKGHTYKVVYHSFRNGSRCPLCSNDKQKLSYEFIKKQIEREKYQLLSDEYISNKVKLKIRCNKGHEYEVTYNNFKAGYRCPICFGNKKFSYEFIKKQIEEYKYKLLSTEYVNTNEKLKIQCDKGHEYESTYSHFQCGSRCSVCWKLNNYGENNPNWKGGLSFEPYCPVFSDKEFKEQIKLRDGGICLNPFCSKKSNRLTIHHIDYDKKHCEQENLITLCVSCNAQANSDREWHMYWYRAIMQRRYKFQYKEIK